MDILYTKEIDCFALMSSDSDFTPLVVRLLESGKEVYGFGGKKTPEPFVKACTQFIYTEDLIAADQAEERAVARAKTTKTPQKEVIERPIRRTKMSWRRHLTGTDVKTGAREYG